jgi:hypothetical protein
MDRWCGKSYTRICNPNHFNKEGVANRRHTTVTPIPSTNRLHIQVVTHTAIRLPCRIVERASLQ